MDQLGCPKKKKPLTKMLKKKTYKKTSGSGPHVYILSGQSSLPCSKLQLMKNIDLQPREWSVSMEQFGGWRWPCGWGSFGPRGLAVARGGDSSAKGRASRRLRARLNSQDGTLQLTRTSLIASPGHLPPCSGRSKILGPCRTPLWNHGVFP